MANTQFFVTRTSGFVGAVIRWATKSSVNHAGFVKLDGSTLEAQPKGAIVGNIANYPQAVVSNISLTPEQDSALDLWMRMHVGTPYNFLDILALFCSRVLNLKSSAINNRLSQNNTDICSQLVDAGLRAIGYNLFDDDRPTGDVTPEDLLEVIRGRVHQ